MAIAIIAFIISLLLLVVAHEFGHFIIARKAGVTVHEFSIGMGPKIMTIGTDKKGTIFNWRLFPIGGYVRIKWESLGDPGALTQNDSFLRASFLWKVSILLGWVTMNILVAWVLFTIGFMIWVKPLQVLPDNFSALPTQSYLIASEGFLKQQWILSWGYRAWPALVQQVFPDMLGATAGLQSGDVIVGVWGIPVNNKTLIDQLQAHMGTNFSLDIDRDGKKQTFKIECPSDSCVLWVYLVSTWWYEIISKKYTLFTAMGMGFHEVREESLMTFMWLDRIITQMGSHGKQTLRTLSGPVWAAKVGQEVLHTGGWSSFMMFAGMLSLALAIFNLLPIPALDGGRLLGVIIQTVFRLKQEKYFAVEGWINLAFFVALLILWVYIMGSDLVRARGMHIPWIG